MLPYTAWPSAVGACKPTAKHRTTNPTHVDRLVIARLLRSPNPVSPVSDDPHRPKESQVFTPIAFFMEEVRTSRYTKTGQRHATFCRVTSAHPQTTNPPRRALHPEQPLPLPWPA